MKTLPATSTCLYRTTLWICTEPFIHRHLLCWCSDAGVKECCLPPRSKISLILLSHICWFYHCNHQSLNYDVACRLCFYWFPWQQPLSVVGTSSGTSIKISFLSLKWNIRQRVCAFVYKTQQHIYASYRTRLKEKQWLLFYFTVSTLIGRCCNKSLRVFIKVNFSTLSRHQTHILLEICNSYWKWSLVSLSLWVAV